MLSEAPCSSSRETHSKLLAFNAMHKHLHACGFGCGFTVVGVFHFEIRPLIFKISGLDFQNEVLCIFHCISVFIMDL